MAPPSLWTRAIDFLKSSAGHKLFGGILGAGASYLLTGRVDWAATLAVFGIH